MSPSTAIFRAPGTSTEEVECSRYRAGTGVVAIVDYCDPILAHDLAALAHRLELGERALDPFPRYAEDATDRGRGQGIIRIVSPWNIEINGNIM